MLQALTRSNPNVRERAESWTWSIAGMICAAPTRSPHTEIDAIQRTRVIDLAIRGRLYQAR